MTFQPIDLFDIQLVPVTPVQAKPFSIDQLIEQFAVGLSARRADKFATSSTLEKILARVSETTEAQRAKVVELISAADPWRIHPGSMRRFFASSWPEAVELFREVMGSNEPEDLQWGLAARLAMCDIAIQAKPQDRKRITNAKTALTAFSQVALGNHELMVDEKAAGLRGFLELCSRGEVPENRPLEAPKVIEGPKEGDEEHDGSFTPSVHPGPKVGNGRRAARRHLPAAKFAKPEIPPQEVPATEVPKPAVPPKAIPAEAKATNGHPPVPTTMPEDQSQTVTATEPEMTAPISEEDPMFLSEAEIRTALGKEATVYFVLLNAQNGGGWSEARALKLAEFQSRLDEFRLAKMGL